ncbi:transposase [Microbulbifer sp. YPW1]|uniref:IS110 family transposase n=1 Tax=Microbulbifer sp. YPW1 TaxID=2745199 RepID=UPI0021082C22|nr:transposase [Microbulbifer sp. YPW1]
MTNRKSAEAGVNVGVDIGKDFLDFYIHERDVHWRSDNTLMASNTLNRLARYKVARLVMEATGRYELPLAEAGFERDMPVIIANPRAIRRYAGAVEQLAKTDKLDAALIAEFAARIQPTPSRSQGKNLRKIKDLLARRRQLMNMRTRELNRQSIMGDGVLASTYRRLIKQLDKEVEWVDEQLSSAIEKKPLGRKRKLY